MHRFVHWRMHPVMWIVRASRVPPAKWIVWAVHVGPTIWIVRAVHVGPTIWIVGIHKAIRIHRITNVGSPGRVAPAIVKGGAPAHAAEYQADK
jgi:hypothetical protein